MVTKAVESLRSLIRAPKERLAERRRRRWGEKLLRLAEQGNHVQEGALEDLERMRRK